MQSVSRVEIPPGGLTLAVGVGLVVTVVAAIIPAQQASRISPLEALRVRGRPQDTWMMQRGWTVALPVMAVCAAVMYLGPILNLNIYVSSPAVFGLFTGASLLVPSTVATWERVACPVMRRVFGSAGRLGSSNIERAKQRTALTVTSLMVGVTMIISIRGMTDAFKKDIRDWINNYIGGDLYVHSTILMRTDFGPRLEAVDGVAAATPVRYVDVKRNKPDGVDETLILRAVEPRSYARVASFSWAASQGVRRR